MKKRFFAILLIVALNFNLLTTTAFAKNAPSDWAKDAIAESIALGWVPETLQGSYQADISRGEFVEVALFFLASQYGYETLTCDSTGAFSRWADDQRFIQIYLEYKEVDGTLMYDKQRCWERYSEGTSYDGTIPASNFDWYNILQYMAPFSDGGSWSSIPYINAAYLLGIINGRGDGTFGANDPITRQEAATMLLRIYAIYGKSLDPSTSSAVFADSADIAPWALDAVAQAVDAGIMTGVGDARFSPLTNYTREQCITTFFRLYNLMPISRINSNVSPFVTMPDAIEYAGLPAFFHWYKELNTDDATILFGRYGGVMSTGGITLIHIFYKTGGDCQTGVKHIDDNFTALSEDNAILTYKDQDGVYELNIKSGVISKVG